MPACDRGLKRTSDVTGAALQLAFSDDIQANIEAVSALVREAAGKGAKIILPPELFEGHYFCRVEDEGLFARARPVEEHPAVLAMQKLAAELKVYIHKIGRASCRERGCQYV